MWGICIPMAQVQHPREYLTKRPIQVRCNKGKGRSGTQQNHAFLLVGIGSGDEGAGGFVGGVIGLVGDAGGNLNIVSGFHPVLEFKVGSMEKFGDALQHINRGFVGLVVMGFGGSAGRHHQQVHADGFGVCRLC